MKSFIRKKLPFIMIVIQAVLIAGILLYIIPGRYRLYDIVLYDASEMMPQNPLIGYAPPAENPEDCDKTDLVFILLTLSELEPQEGVFDFDAIEAKYHIAEYREAKKHAVLRLVCDKPGDTQHRDIPDWLYEKTADGRDYDDPSGKGYCPDYSNAVFIEAHGKALRALADWCARDSFVSYVEMGSIGQNGLWTAFPAAGGTVPVDSVRTQYERQYAECFPAEGQIRLLSSPGASATDKSGNWNDVLGAPLEASQWIRENLDTQISDAGEEQTGTPVDESGDVIEKKTLDDYLAEGDASPWMTGPVGGGLTQMIVMDQLLMENLSDTLAQIRSSHTSFIGPVCPDASRQDTNGSGMILRNVGYCFYLSRLQTTVDFIRDDLVFSLSFTNVGNAPFYWDWPVTMYVFDDQKECIREQKLDLSLSRVLPGTTVTVTGTVPYSDSLLKGYSVGISINSPDGRNFITLGQKGVVPGPGGIHKIYRYRQ